MPRLTYQEMLNIVIAAITAAGGQINHDALIAQLDEATARSLAGMCKNGQIVRRLVALPDAAPVLSYSLPAAPQPPAPQPPAVG